MGFGAYLLWNALGFLERSSWCVAWVVGTTLVNRDRMHGLICAFMIDVPSLGGAQQ